MPTGQRFEQQVGKRTFRIVLIKPSHYDDDGYLIQWWRSSIPSNSLASVYGLLRECAHECVLGPDVEIEIEAYDECNTIIDIDGVIRRINAALRRRSRAISRSSSRSCRSTSSNSSFSPLYRGPRITRSFTSGGSPWTPT
jgi:hypothetical protein